LEGLATLTRVDKGGLLSAKFNCPHWGPTLGWGNGLQVLIEKVPGVALVDKLQAILLMEGNFDFFNKWLFGHVAVNKLCKLGYSGRSI
jgi:hypothetical protein